MLRIKARWRLFQQTDIDTKHLYDIPEYWIQMKRHNLPLFQYTAREVVSGRTPRLGMMFVSYASECTLTYATLFAEIIIDHLKKCGVKLKNSRFQTDNGSEFIGSWSAKQPSIFTRTVNSEKGLVHDTIPPGAHTYQTVHGIIEDEFYEIEAFSSPQAFLAKATQYVTWFNVARRNSYKGNKTPWEITHQRDPTISPQIAILPAMSLDEILRKKLARPTKGGYDIIPYPCGILMDNSTAQRRTDTIPAIATFTPGTSSGTLPARI